MFKPDVKISDIDDKKVIHFGILLIHPLSDKQLTTVEQELEAFIKTQVWYQQGIEIEHASDPVNRYWLSFLVRASGVHLDAVSVAAFGALLNEIMQLKSEGHLELLTALFYLDEWPDLPDQYTEANVCDQVLKLPELMLDADYVLTTENTFDVMMHSFEVWTERKPNEEERTQMKSAVVAAGLKV